MRIVVPLVIELDPRKWNCDEFDGNQAKVRADVRAYILLHAKGAALVEESDATVTLG